MLDPDTPPPFTTPELWEKLKPLARQKRREPTAAEEALWQQVRKRQVAGAKFRRQHAIDRFIVDFICLDARLVIEVDGPVHDYTPEEDATRQEFLEHMGLRVLRFTNEEVLRQITTVIERISSTLVPHPPAPSPRAERGRNEQAIPPGDKVAPLLSRDEDECP